MPRPPNALLPPLFRHPAFILFLASALLIASAFWYGSGGYDLRCQSLWIKLFCAQLWHGDLYPRWLIDMYAGRGSPVFFYYPPLAYYITALFAPLLSLDAFGYYSITASAWLAFYTAGLLFYVWMKEETASESSALIGAILYMAAPHNVAWNFYYWMLFASVWAYAWVPLLLMFTRKLALGKRYSVAGFALSLLLLILTNLPMTLIWGPIAVLYSVIHWRKGQWLRQAARLAGAVILGFGLSAFFLLPALSYIDYANVAMHWTSDSGNYIHFLITLGWRAFSQKLFSSIWIVMLALTVLYACVIPRERRKFLFFAVVSFVALFFILNLSKPFWELLPLLKTIQMPERLFTVPSLCIAVLASAALSRLRVFSYILMLAYLAIIIGLASWDMQMPMEKLKTQYPERYALYMLNIDQYWNYMPGPDLVERYYYPEGLAEVKAHMAQTETLRGDATSNVTEWQPRHIAFTYHAVEPSLIRVRQFYYPGFKAFLNEDELQIEREPESGELIIPVPAGDGVVRVELTALAQEKIGWNLSIVFLLVLCLSLLLNMRQRLRHINA